MYSNDLPDMSEALRQVYEKKANDGNLANNAPPYDRVTRRDVITGRLGKDEMGGKRKKHDCAKKVNYKAEEFDVIPEMHTMLEDGTVTHYDITNGEYIYENVPVEELEILISEKHEHFDNYDKNAEMLEGKYSGSKSHIQRDGTAPAPERTAAERKKDRRILAGYGKGGMEMAVDRAKKERDEKRKSRMKKEEVELQELDIKGAVTGALNKGSQFMKKNPVGRAVGNVLKPVGPGRGTARPSVRTLNTIRQNQQSQMNSFEPEGEMTEGILGGAGLIAGGLAAYKAIKGMQTVNKMRNDAKSGTGLAGRLQNRKNQINKALGNSFEPEGKLVEGIRDEDPEKGTEERKKRLEKKRGHKVDDHPEYAKESATPGQPAEKLKTGRKMFTIPDEERSAAAARLKEKARKKREEKVKKEELEILEGSCGSSKKKKKTYKEEAESKAQQRLMGLALSVKRGDTPMSSVTPQVAKMAREMKEKDLKDFAGTKHDGLPEKVKKEEPEVSSPLVESLVESAAQRMAAKARRETALAKRVDRQASSAQQRAELNAKK